MPGREAERRTALRHRVGGCSATKPTTSRALLPRKWKRACADETTGFVCEDDQIVETGLSSGGRLTIEPGGQIEFSGAPRQSLREVERGRERDAHAVA